MRPRAHLRISFLLILSAAIWPLAASAQTSETDGSALLQRIAQSMKRYARDISEIPIAVDATVSHYDAKGNLKKRRTTAHTMQFVKRFVKDNKVIRELTWKRSGLHWVSKDDANADSSTALLALLFDNGMLDSSHTYALTVHMVKKTVDLRITHAHPCEPFDPMNLRHRFWCGTTDLTLDSETMMPLHASFDEAGLPKEFGGTVYKTFHFDEEFQLAPLRGSQEPMLLPSKIVCRWGTEKGKTVVESSYRANP